MDTARTLRPRLRAARALALWFAFVIAAPTAVLLPGITAATAHDFLVSSDPADGASLQTAPSEAVLTFSDNIIEMAPLMRLTTIDGELLTQGEPRIDGTDAHLAFPDNLPDGEYRLAWSLVSADGHRVEDFITFTIGDPPNADNHDESASPTASDKPADTGGATLDSAPDPQEKHVTGWRITGIVIVIAGLATIAFRAFNRRSR